MLARFTLLILAARLLPAFGLENVVKTESGPVAGYGSSIRVYKGIPYAAPPVGKLRWKAPQPVKPWEKVLVASSFPNNCPQPPLLPGPQSEDCLGLNIWTPAKGAAAKLPVMVWIHGGGFVIGASSQSVYDGAALASMGVVVVSINYRLGMFGFLAHPGLSAESPDGVSGNYGILDMVAALDWVKRNIAGFGGDPSNVTIFGESAGGSAVCLLMVVPQAAGLFQKVIAESAWAMSGPVSSLKESWSGRVPMEQFGEKFGDIASLRSKSTAELMKLQGLPDMSGDSDAAEKGMAFTINVDGKVIPDDPARLFESGRFQHVPLIAGTNADEGTLLGGPRVRDLDSLQSWAAKSFQSDAAAILAANPAPTAADAYTAATKISGDLSFVAGTRAILRAAAKANPNVYQYAFTRVNGVGRKLKWGCFHASEVGYVFHNLPDSAMGTQATMLGDFSVDQNTYDAHDQKLSDVMSDAWVQFAKTGDPNRSGAPRWPRFQDKESYLELGDQMVVKEAFRKPQLDVMDGFHVRIRGVRTSSGGTKTGGDSR